MTGRSYPLGILLLEPLVQRLLFEGGQTAAMVLLDLRGERETYAVLLLV